MIPRSASNGLKALLLAVAVSGNALALQAGDYSVALQDQQGETHSLGTLTMQPAEQGGFSYQIHWDDSRFKNYFLSMRPFKCVPHPVQLICHLVYPYDIRRIVTEQDLTDLEYDLLFLHKTPQEYGINAWNGLYFKLAVDTDGLVGELRETDLNVLQAPPEDGDLRPIDPNELYEASDKHWPRRVFIRKLTGGAPGL